jgi:hypothetical protein
MTVLSKASEASPCKSRINRAGNCFVDPLAPVPEIERSTCGAFALRISHFDLLICATMAGSAEPLMNAA